MRARVPSVIGLLLVILAPQAARADDASDWTDIAPASGVVEDGEVRIEGAGTHRLVTIDNPDIRGDSYAVAGSVRFEGVAVPGYLEMWSYFADGGAYFSRTLAAEGPTASLVGESTGRTFELPFFLDGAAGPERIEINLVLPRSGTVWLGPLDLVGFGEVTEWWTADQGGFIGAVGGILAGLGGTLLGILGSRRRSRRLVEVLLVGGATVGVGLFATGVYAAVSDQPRHVWYPLVLLGAILALVDGLLFPLVRRRYEATELHRIRALDA